MVPGFQPFVRKCKHTLGVAQGWYEFGPLALNRGNRVHFFGGPSK
jgi:hypothetical protein